MRQLLALPLVLGLLPLSPFGAAGDRLGSTEPRTSQPAKDLYEHYDDDFRRLLAVAQQDMGKIVLRYESIAPGLLAKKVTIKGTHRDFGYLTGLIARGYGAKMYRRTAANSEMNRQVVEMYREIYPAYLEKARGIAEAYGMTVDEIDFLYLEGYFDHLFWMPLFKFDEFEKATGFSSPRTQCSLASYFLQEGNRHLVGRNFDALSDRPHFLVESNLDGVYRTIGHGVYSLQQLVPEGINEKGLFIGSAGVELPPKYRDFVEDWRVNPYPGRPSVQYIHLHRIILDTCATVDEALALIRKLNVWFPIEWSHVLLADAQGNAVVVEWDKYKNLHLFPRQGAFTATTNTALLEGPSYAYNTDWRYRTATQLLWQGVSGLAGLTQVMRSIQPPSGPARTLYTFMADLSTREVTTYYRGESFLVPHMFGFDTRKPPPRKGEPKGGGRKSQG